LIGRESSFTIAAEAHVSQSKNIKCSFAGGSGFPAAIRTISFTAIRGWKAAPAINNFLT